MKKKLNFGRKRYFNKYLIKKCFGKVNRIELSFNNIKKFSMFEYKEQFPQTVSLQYWFAYTLYEILIYYYFKKNIGDSFYNYFRTKNHKFKNLTYKQIWKEFEQCLKQI